MRILIFIFAVFTFHAASADIALVQQARKSMVPSSWVKVKKAPLALPTITFVEAVNGDYNNRRKGKLSKYRGKIVVLNFWASWCAPCKKEKPRLDVLARRLNPKKFAVVSLNYGRDEFVQVQKFYERYKIRSLEFMRNTTPSKTVKGKPLKLRGIPASYILDPQGRLIAEVPTIAWTDKRMMRFLNSLDRIYFGG
ncbi:MAG: TlpA disulfide reductase family protein [Pseudomonadota bacterium]